MSKFDVREFLILLCLYVAAASFPFTYFTKDAILLNFLSSALKIAFVIYALYDLNKTKILRKQIKPNKRVLLFLPCFCICFSNLIVGIIENELVGRINPLLLFSQLFLSLVTAFSEELLFRNCAFVLFKNQTVLKRILFSSLIFGGAHFLNFFGSFNPVVFVQVIYTFGIGLVLGLMYEYGFSIVPCITLHFLFNSINNDLFSMIYTGSAGILYYSINIGVGVIVAIYCLVIYNYILKKGEDYASKDLDI